MSAADYLTARGWARDGGRFADPEGSHLVGPESDCVIVQRARDAERDEVAWVQFAAALSGSFAFSAPGTAIAERADGLLAEYRRRFRDAPQPTAASTPDLDALRERVMQAVARERGNWTTGTAIHAGLNAMALAIAAAFRDAAPKAREAVEMFAVVDPNGDEVARFANSGLADEWNTKLNPRAKCTVKPALVAIAPAGGGGK